MADNFFLVSVANLLLGVALGAVGGMMGIGGGLIAIPVLAWLYGMDQHLAQGTALVMILPNVLAGFVRYRQRNHIDLRATVWLAALAMLSTYIAARCAALIDPSRLRVGFALFLIALSAYFTWQLLARHESQPKDGVSPRLLPVVGVMSGIMSGLFSVGGGLVVVPALVIPGAVVALATYAHAGNVDWAVGIPLGLGGILSVSWGVALAHAMAPRTLRMLFCLVLFGTALATLLQH
jgi:uncharacterized membrane protein YfcA